MKLTCSQMDVLISFYLNDDLSSSLRLQVEEHLKDCTICKAKYDIIKTMVTEMKSSLEISNDNCQAEPVYNYSTQVASKQYGIFKNNLSAYIDNELSNDESIKIKKFTISNLQAKNDLQDCYNIRKLMNDSFKKTKNKVKQDYSKNIIKQIEFEEETILGIHPAIKLLILFTGVILVFTSFILIHFSM